MVVVSERPSKTGSAELGELSGEGVRQVREIVANRTLQAMLGQDFIKRTNQVGFDLYGALAALSKYPPEQVAALDAFEKGIVIGVRARSRPVEDEGSVYGDTVYGVLPNASSYLFPIEGRKTEVFWRKHGARRVDLTDEEIDKKGIYAKLEFPDHYDEDNTVNLNTLPQEFPLMHGTASPVPRK